MTDNMLIDGLIKFCDEKSKNIKLKAEPQVFIEIREALLQLKVLKSDGFTEDLLNMGYTKGYMKAIDELAERLKEQISIHFRYKGIIEESDEYADYIDEIAKQLKAGGNNE